MIPSNTDISKLLSVLAFYGYRSNRDKAVAHRIAEIERKIEKFERKPHKNQWLLEDLKEERSSFYGWTSEGDFVSFLWKDFSISNLYLPTTKSINDLFFTEEKSPLFTSFATNSFEVAYFKNKKLRDLLEKLTPPSPVDNYALLSTLTNVMSISEGFFMAIFSNPPPKPTPH